MSLTNEDTATSEDRSSRRIPDGALGGLRNDMNRGISELRTDMDVALSELNEKLDSIG